MIMNRINSLFAKKNNKILSIYFTAGFPELNDTTQIISELSKSGVDLIEIGMPFSDPVADGVTIQNSNNKALNNGMSLTLLFEQLKTIRDQTDVPLVLMGYFNPIFQYGVDLFCKHASDCGIDGVIIPDLPPVEYVDKYKKIFEDNNLAICFLITPQTNESRIREIDKMSNGFIYLVTSSGVTGGQSKFSDNQLGSLDRVKQLSLKTPILAGFGISNKDGFDTVCKYVNGGIVGSSFIRAIDDNGNSLSNNIQQFIQSIIV